MKNIKRSLKLFLKARLDCPKHGMQRVFALEGDDKRKGIGCRKCFEHSPIFEN